MILLLVNTDEPVECWRFLYLFFFNSKNIFKITPQFFCHYFPGLHNSQHTCSPHERTGQWKHSWTSLDVLQTSSQSEWLRDEMMKWRNVDWQKIIHSFVKSGHFVYGLVFLSHSWCWSTMRGYWRANMLATCATLSYCKLPWLYHMH